MENLEKVELLRTKTGATYEQAKKALEACDYDVLDALVYMEKLGEINLGAASYSTTVERQSNEFQLAQKNYEQSCKGKTAGDALNSFFDWCGNVVKKSCETSFKIVRHEKTLVEVPVIVLVILLILAFWITIPLLIVGMFMDCKYSFVGFESTKIDINEMCDRASDACGNIKQDIMNKKDDNK